MKFKNKKTQNCPCAYSFHCYWKCRRDACPEEAVGGGGCDTEWSQELPLQRPGIGMGDGGLHLHTECVCGICAALRMLVEGSGLWGHPPEGRSLAQSVTLSSGLQ